jgi:hypothetical protein
MGAFDYINGSGPSGYEYGGGIDSFVGSRSPGLNLGMLMAAVMSDPSLSQVEKITQQSALRRATGFAPEGTQVSQLLQGGAGALIGVLLARYFGFGGVGQAVSGVSGYGLGRWLGNMMSGPTHSITEQI